MPALTFDEFDPPKLKDAENAVRGHEGGGPGIVSPQGAEGPGQIMPGTFRQYAHPGEQIGNPKDNTEVSNRILRQSYQKYGGDVPRMATDYFSGAGNVAPPGSPTPWKQNRRDVNEPVSAYVANVQSRMPKRQALTFDEFKPQNKALTFDEFKAPWRVPPAQEGPRAGPFAKAPNEQGLSGRSVGPQYLEPSIAARQNAAPSPDPKAARAAAIARVVGPILSPVMGLHWAEHASPEAVSDALAAGSDKLYDFLVEQLRQPLPGITPKLGLTETQANSLAREAVTDLMRRGGEFAPEAIKSPAIKTVDGRIVEGPNHPAIRAAGTDGEPGFTTTGPTIPSIGEGSITINGKTIQYKDGKVSNDNWDAAKATKEAFPELSSSEAIQGDMHYLNHLKTRLTQETDPKRIAELNKEVSAVQSHMKGAAGQKTNFVDREQGAKIATATGQADPEVTSLHSEHLRPTPSVPANALPGWPAGVKYDPSMDPNIHPSRQAVLDAYMKNYGTGGGQPQAAGADVTTKAILAGYRAVPPVPTNALVQSIEDGGQRLRGAATDDKAVWQQFVDKLPPELKDAELQTRFNRFKEEGMPWGDYKILSQPEQDLFKKFAQPIVEENADLWQELKKYGAGRKEDEADPFAELDPEYVHRAVKGKTPEFDPWLGEASTNPIGGFRSRTAPAAKERVYYVMESEKGVRKLVAKTDHGMLVLNKGQQAQPLPRYQGEATSVGDKFSINGEKWSIKQAKTEEIERETGISYHKNFMANAIKSNVQLKSAVRAMNELNRIKETPEWGAYTVPLGRTPPKGYVTPEFPPFRIVHMDPKMAAAIDSFWTAPKAHLGQKIAAINRYIVSALFISPFIHAGNVGTHWFVARGFDWVNPMAYSRMIKTFPEAVVEVVTQGPKYREMLRDGTGLVYGSIANEEFHRKMLQGLGEQIKREPWKWVPILQPLAMAPNDLIEAVYGVSSRLLWMTSDVFMVQRILELRESGMGKLDSIAEAERHIPNYRIPSQVLGQPGIALALKDPSIFAFSRYDYGVFKSYANMAKDLTFEKDAKDVWKLTDPKTKFKAIGNIMALGFLTYYVWPYINQGIQKITGDEDLEFGPRGALKLPMLLRDMASGGKHLGDIIPSLLTLAPIPEMGIQALSGFKDHFSRDIVEPGDWQKGRIGRMGGQVGEWIGQSANPLYAEAAQGMEDRKTGGLRGAGERILRQQLGVRKTPKPYLGRTGSGTYEQRAQHRRTHPRGPIEQLEKRAEEWLGQ